jgi:Holliday junction resolvase RusA-like endonuclease
MVHVLYLYSNTVPDGHHYNHYREIGMKLAFTVPGPVQAKERHRTAALKRCMACRRTVVGYPCKYCGGTALEFVANVSTPGKKSEIYESFVALCAREAGAVAGGTGATRLHASFYFSVPKSRARKLKEGESHTQKPDLDNCLKSIQDGLKQVAWHDDCCVVEIHARKLWTHGEPRAEIVVESLENMPAAEGSSVAAGELFPSVP